MFNPKIPMGEWEGILEREKETEVVVQLLEELEVHVLSADLIS